MQPQPRPRRPDQTPDQTGPADADGAPDVDAAVAGAGSPVRLGAKRPEELGGDPACWLAQVCPDCGRITEGRDPSRCEACGRPLGPD
ncbi:MAG TPA: hypothetical protein VFX70_21745 [Mycobacteriales bacterium]|nr:hypothetical protein [Mycobacteriales bacterium]